MFCNHRVARLKEFALYAGVLGSLILLPVMERWRLPDRRESSRWTLYGAECAPCEVERALTSRSSKFETFKI